MRFLEFVGGEGGSEVATVAAYEQPSAPAVAETEAAADETAAPAASGVVSGA